MASRNQYVASSVSQTLKQSRFAQIPSVQIPRSQFNRSFTHKSAFDGGYLYPIMCDEALPGDTHNLRMTAFVRALRLTAPIMDNLYGDVFFFAVPIRLIWDNWQKFCGEEIDPGDYIERAVPRFTNVTVADSSLSDYMGIPTESSMDFNSLWHRAYNLIWNEWFRDENLQDSVVVDKDDGPDTLGDYVLLRRGKRHDYFSSCLPWRQKGDPVSLSLLSMADVIGDGSAPTFKDNIALTGEQLNHPISGNNALWNTAGTGTKRTMYWDDPHLSADLTAATATTINDLREAFQIQRLLERDARGGTRYTEIIRSHFGVISPDARLQRPEYLGGGSGYINVHPVENTITPGELGAYASGLVTGGFVKSFTEHCVILGLLNIRADLTYQQGLDRQWSRQTRYEFYWPSLAHLGEQPVYSGEIYADGSASDANVFGYQERYAEYRYKKSYTTSVVRSGHASDLDQWHLGLNFASRPLLNDVFIEDDPPLDRVVAVPSQPHFLADMGFSYICARPMPTYSVPGLIDHF